MKRPLTRRARLAGYSLIETMVVMSAVSVALGLSALMIQLVLRMGAEAQTRITETVALEHQAERLRADAHAASGARIETAQASKSGRLILEGVEPGRVVRYRAEPGAIVREALEGESVKNRESCSIGRGGLAHFEIRKLDDHAFAVLVVEPPRGKSVTPAPSLEVLAALGTNSTRPHAAGEAGR